MELKPCPFCGSSNVKNEWVYAGTDLEEYWVECMNCGGKGPWDSDQQQAIEEWNTRVNKNDNDPRI